MQPVTLKHGTLAEDTQRYLPAYWDAGNKHCTEKSRNCWSSPMGSNFFEFSGIMKIFQVCPIIFQIELQGKTGVYGPAGVIGGFAGRYFQAIKHFCIQLISPIWFFCIT
jgi:hypothetical protein